MSHDVVLPGAFAESLAQRGASGVKMLFQHDANQPIGVWASLKEDARGPESHERAERSFPTKGVGRRLVGGNYLVLAPHFRAARP